MKKHLFTTLFTILSKACSRYNDNSWVNTYSMCRGKCVLQINIFGNKLVKYDFCSNKTLKLLRKTEVNPMDYFNYVFSTVLDLEHGS